MGRNAKREDIYKMKFSEKMQERLIEALFKGVSKVGFFRGFFFYMTNSRHRIVSRLDEFILKHIIQSQAIPRIRELAETLKGKSDDETVMNTLRWVKDNIHYATDSVLYGTAEHWSSPLETLTKRAGDCDSQHILLYVLLILAGVPYFRLFNVVGWVYNPNKKDNEYHYYLTYWSVRYDKLVSLDSTFLYDNTSISNRKEFRNDTMYKDIDYIFTPHFMFKGN
jgi:hypothetical protein